MRAPGDVAALARASLDGAVGSLRLDDAGAPVDPPSADDKTLLEHALCRVMFGLIEEASARATAVMSHVASGANAKKGATDKRAGARRRALHAAAAGPRADAERDGRRRTRVRVQRAGTAGGDVHDRGLRGRVHVGGGAAGTAERGCAVATGQAGDAPHVQRAAETAEQDGGHGAPRQGFAPVVVAVPAVRAVGAEPGRELQRGEHHRAGRPDADTAHANATDANAKAEGVVVDRAFYETFWSLQKFFSNPPAALEPAAGWKTFCVSLRSVLDNFETHRLDKTSSGGVTAAVKPSVPSGATYVEGRHRRRDEVPHRRAPAAPAAEGPRVPTALSRAVRGFPGFLHVPAVQGRRRRGARRATPRSG